MFRFPSTLVDVQSKSRLYVLCRLRVRVEIIFGRVPVFIMGNLFFPVNNHTDTRWLLDWIHDVFDGELF